MEFVLKISEPKPRPWASKNSHSKEQEMKIILSTFNPSTPEARWSRNWRLCDGLHWSLLNQSAAIFVPAEVIQKISSLWCSLWRFSSWKRYLSRISTSSLLTQRAFNAKFWRKSQLLKMKSFIEHSYVHHDAVKNLKIKAEAKFPMKIIKKVSYFLGGACWVN